MRLLEIVRGTATTPEDARDRLALAKTLGKVGVVVGNGPGFVGNRMMFPYMYETQFLVEEGATPEQVDAALTDFGMAMGMFAVDDMARHRRRDRAQRSSAISRDPAERQPLVAGRARRGRAASGQKTGKGWYVYGDDRKADSRIRRWSI